MKILIVIKTTGYAYNPVTKIAEILIREFSTCGVECHMFEPAAGTGRPENVPVKMHKFNEESFELDADSQRYLAKIGTEKNAKLKKFCFAVSHPFKAWRTMRNHAMIQDKAIYGFCSSYYEKRINQVIKKEKIDAVLAFYMPEMILKVFSKIQVSAPVFMYQLDPWTLHELFPEEQYLERKDCELTAFSKAAAVFTTQPLFKAYEELPDFQPYLSKMTTVEFPRMGQEVIPSGTSLPEECKSFDSDFYNIVYTGTISDVYRDPSFFLSVLQELIQKNKNIRVYFMGINFSDSLTEYAKKYPANIILISPQDPAVAALLLTRGDALLNISNTLRYSMPSKVIEYVATGKPIINVVKIENCTSLRYLDKYPLGLTLFETESKESASEKLFYFCKNTKHSILPFSDIAVLYEESTPKYVAEKMLNVIKETMS